MREEIEKRLHRVLIKIDDNDIKCPVSQDCVGAENCQRCNKYYLKCSKYGKIKIKYNIREKDREG